MGGSSKSSQKSTTTSYVDSFNSTYEQVLNLSNVGNIGLNFAPPPSQSSLSSLAGPLILAAVAIGGALILKD